MKIGKYLPIVILICVGLAFATADAQENLAQQVSAIFQQSCSNCHGPSGSFKEALLIERNALIDTQVVIPGNPENSEFYKRLLGPTENGPQMPLNLPPLSPEAVETIARWITTGAPDWNVQHDTNFITTDTILDTIRTHLKSLDPFDRPSARYFTMTHLYNAGEAPETLSDYRIALSKLINSLSWKFEITNPIPIDEAQTIFYIDLRRYEWNTTTDVWTQIEQVYPYNIAFDPETQAGLLEKLTHLQTETGSTVPFVHVDWFLATASLPPLYHDILGLPQTDRVLEAQLEVNVASNIRNAPGIDVWRAGFNDSGVSSNNRVVERHTSRYGAYWKSYDFAGSVGSQNIFTHPLDFTHDGGEIIFNLPNGLQAYLLVDANGNRLNDAPIDIVSNPAASDPTVRNGLSCIGCHTQGMKKFEDSVRAAIEQNENQPYNKEQALRLYAKQSVLDNLVAKDTLRFQQALEKIGGPFSDDASRQRFFKQHENEPIQRFHESFQAPLNASDAAAAVGLETDALLTQIREKQSLKNLGLQTLVDVNGTVKRDAWTSYFDDVISALNTPDSTLPPVVERPERIPGAGVYIPDPNLRAAIAEALGKAPGDPITVEDMTMLTDLDARNYDEPRKENINNLTGLEFAVNLKFLHIGGNSVSDLSPLAGLIKLDFLDVQDNLISDILPLKGLTRLKDLVLTDNVISDFSPLMELTTLKEVWISDSPAFDLSLLGRLINLEGVHAWDVPIKDLSPLAGLTKLRWLDFGRIPISDLAPLANLTNLRKLIFYDCGIEDISSLAGLKELRFLIIPHNAISDLSPLAGLTRLETLHIVNNEISDVSPLAGLTNLGELNLRNNPITDFSPLEALSENINILTGEVTIPDPNLRAAIAEALGKGDTTVVSITAEEMATLTSLVANDRGIQDLIGLEFAINLENLWFEHNQVSDLSPIAKLTKLHELRFVSNQVSDLSPIAKLTKLRELRIDHNPISDLSPIAGFTQLEVLSINEFPLSDISPLSGLVNLKTFHSWGSPIVDMSPLVNLSKLETLDLCGAKLANIPPLDNLKNLKTLYLVDCNISDLSSLSSLRGLEHFTKLNLHRNNIISDLSPLAMLANLKWLNLSWNNISDVSALTDLSNLKWLSLELNNVSDVSPLAKLTNLEWLNLTKNPITDFSVLAVLSQSTNILTGEVVIPDPNLRAAIAEALGKGDTTVVSITAEEMVTLTSLVANNRGIQELTGLEFAINLDYLAAHDNQIADLSPLSELTNLRVLDVWHNPIESLSPITGLSNLEHITLVGDGGISDLSPLAGLAKLRHFLTWGNPISDLSPLAGLTQLETLDICGSKASDISPLAKLTALKELYLVGNDISDVSPLSGLTNLKRLSLERNSISDVSSLVPLINLKWLGLHHNSISDFSPLAELSETTIISRAFNPGVPTGGPKIEGPWSWVTVPGERLDGKTDLLAEASAGTITEQQAATNGVIKGESVGNNLWTQGKIAPSGDMNIVDMLDEIGSEANNDKKNRIIYGSIVLDSPREQSPNMFFGTGGRVKIWLNGGLVYQSLIWRSRHGQVFNYHDFLSVTLKQGTNTLLVAIDDAGTGWWSGFFGFEEGTEYTVSTASTKTRVEYVFSKPQIHVDDTFTLDLSAANVQNLAGWQFDIAFDPTVVEAVEVNEGDFLKTGGGATFFQKGTIDNTTGKITKLSSARLGEDGVSGKGTLLSVTFTAKTTGQTQLKLENFQLAAITGVSIPAGPHEVVITVERQLATGDVNRDGQVNILDMVLVARHFGKTVPANSEIDMNGDGVVNIQDLIIVAQHLGESTTSAAPLIFAVDDIEGIDPAMIQAWIEQAQIENDGSIAFQQGIANLERLLALFIPEETALLHNYPNPFNPETWIPYQLSEPAEVTLRIYAVNGSLIRTLAFGQMPAGIYQTRTRAAFWDGKNNVGESVASGVYFYTLTAGDFNATRKMLIRK